MEIITAKCPLCTHAKISLPGVSLFSSKTFKNKLPRASFTWYFCSLQIRDHRRKDEKTPERWAKGKCIRFHKVLFIRKVSCSSKSYARWSVSYASLNHFMGWNMLRLLLVFCTKSSSASLAVVPRQAREIPCFVETQENNKTSIQSKTTT